MHFQRLTLEKTEIGLREFIGQTALEGMKFSVLVDHAAGGFVAQLRLYLMGNTIHTEKEIIERPASWWQAFKAARFPGWLKGHFPVVYEQIVVRTEHKMICPHLNISLPGEERYHLEVMIPRDHEMRVAR
jgi:hypothetical protein